MKSKILFAIFLSGIFLFNCGNSKLRTILTDTTLVENPGEKKPVFVQNGKVKRGEYVKFLEEKTLDGKKYFLVQVEGTSTKGWIEDKAVREGKLESATVILDSDLFIRPNEKSEKAGTAKSGQNVFKLETSGNFVLIQFPGKEAYIELKNLGPANMVMRSVNFPGLGKAVITSSSQYIASEGKENEFDPRNLFDGSLQTAWCEGKNNDDGVGEWVNVQFDEYVSIYGIGVVNGYAKSEANYKNNNRVSSLRVTSDSADLTVDLKDDVYDYQDNGSGEMTITGKNIKFIINGAFKGKASDTCMSEIKISGTKGSPYHGY
ncbi:MAG: discoidin domain-containing protein [Leptospiraceae bacterium]|nr:hypothetical protein [Leptospiraceae bacterium]MCK6381529.1 discoidin domain-containing protein [Leptospiraceae bacterium]NUM40668.1 hypothetical protein [Leptospiraceae bacterium]